MADSLVRLQISVDMAVADGPWQAKGALFAEIM